MTDILQWAMLIILTVAVLDLRSAARNLTKGIRILDRRSRR